MRRVNPFQGIVAVGCSTSIEAGLSPYLLGRPDLGDATRLELEQAAASHARLVDAVWRLYPVFLDQGLFNRIRVEVRLSGRLA